MSKLYLGFWKNLSYLESTERAAIVLALKPVRLFIILLMLLLLRRILVKLIFWIINTIHELISSGKSFEARATSINRIAERYETVDAKVNNMHTQRWIVGILLIITAYYLVHVAVIIYAPQISDATDQTYLGSFLSSKAEKYQKYEADMLQKADDYQPLIPVDSQDVKQQEESETPKTEEAKDIWLSLSKKGKKGTNVKKKPSKKSKKIASVSGKDKVLFLARNKDGWIKVQLKNGKKGWINEVFLKGVPD